MHIRTRFLCLLALPLGGCLQSPEADFWNSLTLLCGQAFEGEIVSDDAADDAWRAERVVMHMRDCSASEIRIPLAVGDDLSRTWVLTRDKATMGLHHLHLHEDGSEDALTGYGGIATEDGSGTRQTFPADETTKALFDREGIPVSNANVWAIEVDPSESLFTYELARPGRFFRVEFDTSNPVPPPPQHWGAAD
tara:strand:+ start:4168 stop:4746 length:579 start_codon:yes stop_codon:yes gene_type:complete